MVVFVTGVPRSGTSAVAGVLHRLGVWMGDIFPDTDARNSKGYYEYVPLTRLHAAALNDTDAERLPGITPRMIKGHSYHLDKIEYRAILKRINRPLWGIKDPRLIFPNLLDDLVSMTGPCKLIYTRRSATASAESWCKMMVIARGPARRFIADCRVLLDRTVAGFTDDKLEVDYNRLVDEPEAAVKEIAGFVGVAANGEAVGFVDKRLRHW